MISLMFGIAGGFMVLMLQLALWMIQTSIVVGVELGVIQAMEWFLYSQGMINDLCNLSFERGWTYEDIFGVL